MQGVSYRYYTCGGSYIIVDMTNELFFSIIWGHGLPPV